MFEMKYDISSQNVVSLVQSKNDSVEYLMPGNSVLNALSGIKSYLFLNYDSKSIEKIITELHVITEIDFSTVPSAVGYFSYDSLQRELATLNEKSEIRKKNGIYYTPDDIVEFIIFNSIKFLYDKLECDSLNNLFPENLPYENFCYDCTLFDPTCGSGAFILASLGIKLNLLDKKFAHLKINDVHKVVATLYGNDINPDSVLITKLRLFLCVLDRYGADFIQGLSEIFSRNFFQCDFVNDSERCAVQKYDIIIGNPPYVEDSKSKLYCHRKYGNIYANVLANTVQLLKDGGIIGFVVPLSYISTPRMRKIREEILQYLPQQYILSFADRPDCLFVSVHQKLCILLAGNKNSDSELFTGSYQYWYKEEREHLFNNIEVVSNNFIDKNFIPKLGNVLESRIYKKVLPDKISLANSFFSYGVPVYLNMRATYWIKAFLNEHLGAEYKIFRCADTETANLSVLLLNSSLFWWYWVCVSDCWHITSKELAGFKFPRNFNSKFVAELVSNLEHRLESTKKYVGTKQTEYEYKHKSCVDEIHKIDDYVSELYGLNDEETFYIKNFAYRYRTGEGCAKL